MKRVGSRQYVHRSALSQLSAGDRRRVEALARQVPEFAWSVARVEPDGVMLGETTAWDRNDHPALQRSITLKGDRLTLRTYKGARPIYHRCETMLDETHPRYRYFSRLSAREARAGKLSRPDIGWGKRAR